MKKRTETDTGAVWWELAENWPELDALTWDGSDLHFELEPDEFAWFVLTMREVEGDTVIQ